MGFGKRLAKLVCVVAAWYAVGDPGRAAEPSSPSIVLQGSLGSGAAGEVTLNVSGRAGVRLVGDRETLLVLSDPRLTGAELGVRGRWVSPNQFEVEPFHKKSFWVYKGGQRWLVFYWCDVCGIRTYTPGKCLCCQEETELKLERLPSEPGQAIQ